MNLRKKIAATTAACGALVLGATSQASAALPQFYTDEVANVSALATDGATAAAVLFTGALAIIGGFAFLKSGGHFVLNWVRSVSKRMS